MGSCTCATEEIEPHGCPYSADVHGDYDTKFTCCPFCEHECAMDI